ncbi:beta-mannosyltransferase [Actinomycetia phage DSL-LC01]|nr:beta-mannosyltransferase [Actinomycetia phage DSL-LC01]
MDPEVKTWSAFNPSIGVSPDGQYAVAIRSSNYVILESGELHVTVGGPIANQVWFAELDDDLKIQNLRKIDFSKSGYSLRRGIEDPKLLWRDGGWQFTGVMMEQQHTKVARHCHCIMDKAAKSVTKIEVHKGVEARKPEKNWMTPYEKSPHFDYIYGPSAIIKDDKMIHTLVDNPDFTGLRGNSHMLTLEDGTLLTVMHKLWSKTYSMYSPNNFGTITAKDKNYFHYFARFDERGTLIQITEPFQFISRGIEFAAGLVEKDGSYIVSFGKEDVSSHLGIIDKNKVMKMLVSINK